ncbi:hypothetical protein [Microbulbifer agarilyticus]|uniref:hypothetical protein n=1 Tax=Microbulbifer agarilyticus TaxID=260552 RepID=UPI001C93C2B3|nr:hypothetical protein [Microbulbifer agarilyticus]MBY6191380.1 hypothetical protein [Microbulbifer agarilyticus]MBY6212708.1 hypothetical protein [Microbulbifer agarilyticus]MCA0894322.1 hypothetical protein [Microbulbifer agarilyticus]MCA0901835.1 hypothetical protein [Microbulbifer agarilyticus]
MSEFPASFSPIQLHNRLNRPVWVGFKLARRGSRHLVMLSAGAESGAKFSKNFETFVGQIVREFKLDPEQTDFVELRQDGAEGAESSDGIDAAAEAHNWFRWHAQWVGSAPMECKADPVTSEAARNYLEEVLTRSNAAA